MKENKTKHTLKHNIITTYWKYNKKMDDILLKPLILGGNAITLKHRV